MLVVINDLYEQLISKEMSNDIIMINNWNLYSRSKIGLASSLVYCLAITCTDLLAHYGIINFLVLVLTITWFSNL